MDIFLPYTGQIWDNLREREERETLQVCPPQSVLHGTWGSKTVIQLPELRRRGNLVSGIRQRPVLRTWGLGENQCQLRKMGLH